MKTKRFTKIIAFLLCFAMAFSMLQTGIVAFAAEETTPPVEDGIIDTENPDKEEEEEDVLAEAVEVSSSEQLASALSIEASAIKIVENFQIDRTFYIVSDTVIFSDAAHTLTRAADFGGDVFVVGQYEDGTVCEEEVSLSFGHENYITANLLTVDGNRDNMTVDVFGTVFFGCANSHIELHAGVTVKNCKKVGNERTLLEMYELSYPELIGGPVAITAGGSIEIYGGNYANNAVIEDESATLSARGGAFYFFGPATIYGGTFEGNRAHRGGAFYSYRTLKIYGANIKDNYASTSGGAIYMPASTACYLYIDGEDEQGDGGVTFKQNHAGDYGGAIICQGASVNINAATFTGNTSGSHGGALYCSIKGDEESDAKLTITNSTLDGNITDYSGGALYLSGTHAYLESVTFSTNHSKATANSSGARYGGGAVYSTGSYVEINEASFLNNTSDNYGAALEAHSGSKLVLNKITTAGNYSTSNGTFLFANNSETKLYNSAIRGNKTDGQGGAAYLTNNATLHAYITTFENNSAKGNGGAILFYTNAVNSLLHSCVFLDNASENYGGAIYISKASILDTYNLSAKGNSALRGGFMYETTTGTTVTLNGLSVSGNSASDGGPIIWGNSTGAKLYINKTNYIDVDTSATPDDEYWAAAIVNKLTVEETTAEIPGFINYGDTEETSPEDIINPNVTNAIELQTALAAEIDEITILSDFVLDRTFYVTGETTIRTNGDRTLTRAPHFGGDIFVIGEYATGDACEETAVLNINPGNDGCSLTIDGNRDNMTADVVGTVFFVCNKANLVLNDPLTVQNCHKVGNERTLNEAYGLSYTHRIGGPVIINAGSTLDIYGGTFKNNSVLDETDENTEWISTQGGAVYSFGLTNIYGGVFENNHAARGGAIYNYRKTNIYNAEFNENTASTMGGAIYMAASTACYLYTGGSTNLYDSFVSFKNNKSEGHGGAIVSQGALTHIKNTEFVGNESGNYGGAIYTSAAELNQSKFNVIIEDSTLFENSAYNNGGAVYQARTSVHYKNVDFGKNHAFSNSGNYGGGAIYTTGAYGLFEGVRFTENSSDCYGGAIMFNSASIATLYNVTAKGNSADGGGFIYSKSTVDIYNSLIDGNSATGGAGGIMLQTDAVTNIISTVFSNNTAVTNGAALNVYTGGTQTTLNNCQFNHNKSQNFGGGFYVSASSLLDLYNCSATGNEAYRGGFIYETTTGTVVTLNNLTVSGNTASDGGPIIWGNSTGAKLYINKTNYTDTENSSPDSAYWDSAIVNKLKVYEITDAAPECGEYGSENYDNLEGYVSVSDAAQLEAAVNNRSPRIRIIADFAIDRTIYITSDTTIFSTTPYRLTRAADFAGDLFVIGEKPDGTNNLLESTDARLTLGNPLSQTADLLTIDGNKNNMTVDVVGSILFVCNSATANIYNNVTIINALKVGNERTLNDRYTLSYPNRVGGAMAIVESGSLNIYGGSFQNHRVSDEIIDETLGEDGKNSTLGGAIYNMGNLSISGGTFEFCKGTRGGVIYNYRITHIYGGDFINNYASSAGGAIYLPSTALTHLYIGNDSGEDTVNFKGNMSKNAGGAIYSGVMCSTIIYGGTAFHSNTSLKSNGGAIYVGGTILANDTEFENNTAYSKGGAVYVTHTRDDALSLPEFTDCSFLNNTAASGGAITAYAANMSLIEGSTVTLENCVIKNNEANNGGAIYISYKSTVNLKDTLIENNICKKEGGAIYAIYESTINADNCEFIGNTSGDETTGYGGAISLHSTLFNGNDLTFSKNTAGLRGGAIYVSYNSVSLKDSVVDIKNSTLSDNHCYSLGGAMYVVDRLISYGVDEEGNPLPKEDNNTINLILSGVTFQNNTAVVKGGAAYLTTYSHTFMSDVIFTENRITEEGSGHNAGAIYSASRATFEINGGQFKDNSSGANGGAIGMYSNSSSVMNNVTASGNTAVGDGGFMLCDTAYTTIHNSNISGNTAGSQGGAVSLVDLSTISAYNTEFNNNTSSSEGGALHVYPGASQSVLHSCSFTGNTSGTLGGAIYMANCSLLDVYNSVGTSNHANKGGFIYETTYNSVLTVNGLTVSGNTDNMGGPIIWGNTLNAKLLINKANYVDKDVSVLDDTYWAGAIYNLLTVSEISDPIPECPTYAPGYTPETEKAPTVHPEVSVEHIFELAQNADKGKINSTYSALPKLDTSSNFMSRETTLFPSINGTDVTVDSFVYHKDDPANNGNVGEGIMIYQAMCYKRAHPDEDVSIAISAYRFSANTALCIDRSSPYFGYLRPLYNEDYDKFGFVRIAYLLLCAARMGINVTVIAQLDGYPNTSTSPRFEPYFTEMLDAPCDSTYVSGKVIGDYMTFRACKWMLEGKGGSDMMHTKLCAVSHYLDKDGIAHRNAVWTSSSNLDGINGTGTNGLNQLQTATIISDHAEIYRVSTNYLRFLADYCEQEDVYIFRDICTKLFKEQIDMIRAGRESEIPADEQMMYLGSENDNVFELYFSPFGGEYSNWEESYNPFTKQVRELSNSEDSIIFIWNNVRFGEYSLRNQLEDVIVDAFHKNKNPENKIYVNLPGFDSAAFNDLALGTDIGYKAFNQNDFGHVHNKDMQLSYVKDGQRYYVSLLNSMNVHAGSMAYQSNFALVIKETDGAEGSVFFALADQSTTGIVSHDYQDTILEYIPQNEKEDGYTYRPCANCDERLVLETIHRPSDWTAVKVATKDENGIAHRSCTACSTLLETREYVFAGENENIDSHNFDGKQFSNEHDLESILNVNSTPATIEATIQLDKSVNERGGVIVGNYSYSGKNLINLEVYHYGKIRLFYINDGKTASHVFKSDIRSNEAVNLAVTVEGTTAKLYINSTLAETAELPFSLPNVDDTMWIGGDKRTGNGQFFKGTIYSVHLFDHVRSEEQLSSDAVAVFPNEQGLLATRYFTDSSSSQVGATFSNTQLNAVDALASTPHTIEATVQLGDDFSGRGGVIVGNYSDNSNNILSLEISLSGRVRLYVVDKDGNVSDCIFSPDIRGSKPVHITVTINGKVATLYLNGEIAQTKTLKCEPSGVTEGFIVGGDNRKNNTQYFKGYISNVSMFSDIRTAEEISADMLYVSADTEGLLFNRTFTGTVLNAPLQTVLPSGMEFTADTNIATGKLSSNPLTIEATVQLDKSLTGRGGVIVGNYSETSRNLISLEAYNNGKLRLYIINNGKITSHVFSADIRSDRAVHIALTVDETNMARLYLNSEFVENVTLSLPIPTVQDGLRIGGDYRLDNTQYFKGRIYSVNLFSSTRSAEQIKNDMVQATNQNGDLIYSKFFAENKEKTFIAPAYGVSFSESSAVDIPQLSATPHTIEATVQLSTDQAARAGVIVGNFKELYSECISLEIHTAGRVRLFYTPQNSRKLIDCTFNTDIRGVDPVHIAVTIDGLTASLYLNGEFAESKTLTVSPGEQTEGFKIGGDNREGNVQYFKGAIYSVNLFSDVRTAEEIKADANSVDTNDDALLYTNILGAATEAPAPDVLPQGETFTAQTPFILEENLDSTPLTMEATVQLSKDFDGRAGIIFGNYDAKLHEMLNFEICTEGRPRLFYTSKIGVRVYCDFDTDIRSENAVHLAVTVNDLTATLYVNGQPVEQKSLPFKIPTITENFKIGGDNRSGNQQYFNGKIYSVNLFSTARTDAQIMGDAIMVDTADESLLYSVVFASDVCAQNGHTPSDVIVDTPLTDSSAGLRHTECTVCGKKLEYTKVPTVTQVTQHRLWENIEGLNPMKEGTGFAVDSSVATTPHTIEAVIQLDKSYTQRAGIIVGNYDGRSIKQLNFEIYTNGRPRLYYCIGTTAYSYIFKTDIRSASPQHIALTVDGKQATLYINGEAREAAALTAELPEGITGLKVGTDNRSGTPQYFAGTIYSVSLLEGARTAEEIAIDRYLCPSASKGLLFDKSFIVNK